MRHNQKRLALLLLALVLIGAAYARTSTGVTAVWAPPDNLSDPTGTSTQATSALDPSTGRLFVAWVDGGTAEREEILGRRWDPGGQMWEPGLALPAENLSRSEWQDGGPLLFFDSQGQGLLLWTRRYLASQGALADGTDLLWRSWDGVSWSDEMVLFHVDSYLPSNYGYGIIPIETLDAILWFITWNESYRTVEYQNGMWYELSPWMLLDVRLAQVIRDEQGVLHAAAYGDNSSQTGFDWIFQDGYYLSYDGISWTAPVNLSFTDGVVRDLGLAFDVQGRLHFLWSDPDSLASTESLKSAIWERVLDGEIWTANTEITVGNAEQAINGFSLTTGADGTFHLGWSEGLMVDGLHTDLGIYYRQGDGNTWGAEEAVYLSASESRYPVLAVEDAGRFIIWQEGPPADREVYFSRRFALWETYRVYLPLING